MFNKFSLRNLLGILVIVLVGCLQCDTEYSMTVSPCLLHTTKMEEANLDKYLSARMSYIILYRGQKILFSCNTIHSLQIILSVLF